MRKYIRKSPYNLDENIVKNVEKLYRYGVPKIVIAESMGISRNTVYKIVRVQELEKERCSHAE